MEFRSIDFWDEALWGKWRGVYEEAFGKKGGKRENIIRNMFRKKMCSFHIAIGEAEGVFAIALTGKLKGTKLLLIDYLAVPSRYQNKGYGRMMVEYIKKWATSNNQYDGIVIEVEAEKTQINQQRIQFWLKCGFTETEYVHDYKVVPEPYKAMYLRLSPHASMPEKDEEFFYLMGQFHRNSFQGAKNSK